MQLNQKNIMKKEIEEKNNLQKYFYNIKNEINFYKFFNINYSNSQIFSILIKANKEKREKFKIKFIKLISEKEEKNNLEKLICFYNIKYVAASDEGLIIITNTKSQANWISFEMCNLEFRNKIFKKFNYNFILIILSKNEWIKVRIDYFEFKKTNKILEKKTINVNDFYKNLLIEQINNYEKHKKNIEIGRKIFNNIIIIK